MGMACVHLHVVFVLLSFFFEAFLLQEVEQISNFLIALVFPHLL
jgi:hypothetical protein